MGTLDGRIAIITGAGRGIGRGIARALAKEGASIAVAEIDPETGPDAVQELVALGARSMSIECDVRDRKQVEAATAQVASKWGGIDILINNATGARKEDIFGPAVDQTDEQFDRVLDVDVKGSFFFMRACFPHLKKSAAARVINISSCDGSEFAPFMAAYTTAKEALRALTGSVAKEWGAHGITVNCLCPNAATEGLAEYWKMYPDQHSAYLAKTPMGREGDSEFDVGRTIVFLVGPDASYITGQTINVDGGYVSHA
jgi:NAD(P)-dependent dehydrogenase (short-subunit alcohol dehydrogenase family)